jgi:hypothetical protein
MEVTITELGKPITISGYQIFFYFYALTVQYISDKSMNNFIDLNDFIAKGIPNLNELLIDYLQKRQDKFYKSCDDLDK